MVKDRHVERSSSLLTTPRSRVLRTALTATAALALTVSSAAAATAAQTAHPQASARRACAVPAHPGIMSCLALIRAGIEQHPQAFFGKHAPTGDGYGPADLKSAYKLPAGSAGAGQTVAVIDAYDDPDAAANLATYRSAWGQPACNTTTGAGCLTKVNQNGKASPLPAAAGSTGWATEESTDVDMVSAVCPKCHILLVETKAATTADLGTGVNSAVTLGAGYVANSYGGTETSGELSDDTLYYKHPGVAVVAAGGDSGTASYPAASQYVTAVGGTTLTKTATTTRGWTETPWGSGACSAFEPEPSWQKAFTTGCGAKRSDNDVAAVGDPTTGVAVYDTYDQSGWLEVGGTSVSCPIITGVYALAGPPAAGTYPASYPYADPGGLFDLSPGGNQYDPPVGLGSPDGVSAFS
jgi:subtilase family serine protease